MNITRKAWEEVGQVLSMYIYVSLYFICSKFVNYIITYKFISYILFLLKKDTDPKICQKKQKNLRDTFLRKYKDEKNYIASGSAAINKVMNNWKYYEQMKFFKPTTKHRR